MRVQSYLRLSNLRKYLNKQYIETSNLLVKIVKESEKSKKKDEKAQTWGWPPKLTIEN